MRGAGRGTGNWQYFVVLAGMRGRDIWAWGINARGGASPQLKCLCDEDTTFQPGKDQAFSYGGKEVGSKWKPPFGCVLGIREVP